MSDSPIFDSLNSERDYTGTMESFRKEMTRYFRTAKYIYIPEQSNLPDPYLDGPYVEAEEEVLVSPFVPVKGVVRGTISEANPRIVKLELSDAFEKMPSAEETFNSELPPGCTPSCAHESGIRGLLEHVGIDTSNGIRVGDRVVAEPLRDTFGRALKGVSEVPTMELKAKVLGVSSKLVEGQLEAHGVLPEPVEKRERREDSFHPLDLEKQGISFTDYVKSQIEWFRKSFPHVNEIRTFIEKELDGTETIVVESADPTPPFKAEGVPEGILQGRTTAEFWESVDISPKALRAAERRTLEQPEPNVIKPKVLKHWFECENGAEAASSVIEDVRKAFNEQHPGYIMTAVNGIKVNDDGSATLKIEAQELPPIKPLSEKNTAQLME
jgi:hypothetical protein